MTAEIGSHCDPSHQCLVTVGTTESPANPDYSDEYRSAYIIYELYLVNRR
jgi:hypothetical protein